MLQGWFDFVTYSGVVMKYSFAAAALATLAACLPLASQAQTEIQWWHSMGGALGEWVNDQAKDFNAAKKTTKWCRLLKAATTSQ